jgi:hypothetical protein
MCGENVLKIIMRNVTISSLIGWAFVSLGAIVLVQINPLLGLIVAAIGGIFLGLLQFAK